jgi:hypothetical protein
MGMHQITAPVAALSNTWCFMFQHCQWPSSLQLLFASLAQFDANLSAAIIAPFKFMILSCSAVFLCRSITSGL